LLVHHKVEALLVLAGNLLEDRLSGEKGSSTGCQRSDLGYDE
jgi:hypothetical protein